MQEGLHLFVSLAAPHGAVLRALRPSRPAWSGSAAWSCSGSASRTSGTATCTASPARPGSTCSPRSHGHPPTPATQRQSMVLTHDTCHTKTVYGLTHDTCHTKTVYGLTHDTCHTKTVYGLTHDTCPHKDSLWSDTRHLPHKDSLWSDTQGDWGRRVGGRRGLPTWPTVHASGFCCLLFYLYAWCLGS